ncbi:hypothetical protein [Zobellella sp. DQSA1]|uniref:hypothetical protein n=1 Tax=Zobellella sp. DQSA1 TaxID=3342386 RepID=UPI0035C0D80E
MLLGYGAAAAGALLILLAMLIGGVLLAWQGWRFWMAYRGTPRPPLSRTACLLVSVIAIYPVLSALMMIMIKIEDLRAQRAEYRWNQRTFFTLREATPFGDITLPAGSRVNRTEPRTPGVENSPITLDGLTRVRLPQPQIIAGMAVSAFEVLPAVMELAAPHQFILNSGAQRGQTVHCEAGWLATFTVPEDLAIALHGDLQAGQPAAHFRPSRWRFRSCFPDSPITILALRDGQVVALNE